MTNIPFLSAETTFLFSNNMTVAKATGWFSPSVTFPLIIAASSKEGSNINIIKEMILVITVDLFC